jgi:hypothetical protein
LRKFEKPEREMRIARDVGKRRKEFNAEEEKRRRKGRREEERKADSSLRSE